MCNDYEQHIAYQAYVDLMQAEALKVRPDASGAWRTAEDIRIGDTGPAVRVAATDEAEVVPMRFGWPAPRPKASPVFNFRSEGRSFAGSNRCLIPASAFFEFTGAKYPKTKHRFGLADGQPFSIAGLWKPGKGNQPDAFTMLTTEPGPDVAPIHGRQVAVLPPGAWRDWLELRRPEGEMLRPLPAGGAHRPDSEAWISLRGWAWELPSVRPLIGTRCPVRPDKPTDDPIEVVPVPGGVVVMGPRPGALLTPHAAIRSAERLLEAATRVMTGQVEPLPDD